MCLKQALPGSGCLCLQATSIVNCEVNPKLNFLGPQKHILAALLVRDQGSHSRHILVIHKFFLLERKRKSCCFKHRGRDEPQSPETIFMQKQTAPIPIKT